MIIKEGKSNVKHLLIVVVLSTIIGGIIYWQYQEMQKEEFGGMELNIPEKEKVCSFENPENCDRNCKVDEDCIFPCDLGFCVNRNQKFKPKEDEPEVCGIFFCKCTNNTCEEIEPYIKVLSPNGGEKLVVGDVHTITWDSLGIGKIDIGYRKEGSGAEIKGWIGKNISASEGSYLWTVTGEVFSGPEYVSGSFELIIGENPFHVGMSRVDRSDGLFTIVRESEITD